MIGVGVNVGVSEGPSVAVCVGVAVAVGGSDGVLVGVNEAAGGEDIALAVGVKLETMVGVSGVGVLVEVLAESVLVATEVEVDEFVVRISWGAKPAAPSFEV